MIHQLASISEACLPELSKINGLIGLFDEPGELAIWPIHQAGGNPHQPFVEDVLIAVKLPQRRWNVASRMPLVR